MGSKSNSSNSTTNNVTNYSLQGVESDGAVVAGNGNTVTTTDHGAVDAALGFGDSALEFAGGVVDANQNVTKYAMDKNSALAGQTIGFANNAIESSLDFSRSLVDQNTANAASSNLAVKDLAKSLATGGSSDVAKQSTKMVYTMGVVIVAVIGFAFIGMRK